MMTGQWVLVVAFGGVLDSVYAVTEENARQCWATYVWEHDAFDDDTFVETQDLQEAYDVYIENIFDEYEVLLMQIEEFPDILKLPEGIS